VYVCVCVCGCVCVCPPLHLLNQLIDFHEIVKLTPADVISVRNSESSSNY